MSIPKPHPAGRARDLIGRYVAGKMEILEHLGGGGMGWVFSAYHHTLGKRVAIKVLKRKGDELHAKRFEVEARSASRLEHPNAVTILDFGEDGPDRLVYLAMEFLEGQDLDRIIRNEAPIAPRRASALIIQALAGLSSAHESGVIHRDLKPANIMVTNKTNDDGEVIEFVKVCDFGLAKIMDADGVGQGLTRRGMIVGTPDYMSPEQAVGDVLDGRTDVYACGVILYEMLTKRRPFEAEDPGDVLLMHLNDVPRRPREWVPTIPAELERVVLWALEKRPDRRASSARELRDALKRFLTRPDYDLPTVVDVPLLRAALERTSGPSPESITDQLQVPVIDVASVDTAAPARAGPDTLIDEPVLRPEESEELPSPVVDQTPRLLDPSEQPPPSTETESQPRAEVIAQDTLRSQGDAPPEAFDYEGPHPFWILGPSPRRIGPCDYPTLDRLMRGLLDRGQAREASLSADGVTWLGMPRFLELTAQEALLPEAIPPIRGRSTFEGRFEQTSPVAMFSALAKMRPSGRVVVQTPALRAEVYLREGQPVDVRSSHPDEQLPALLVSRQLVGQDNLPGLIHAALESDTRVEEVLATAVDVRVLRTAMMKERLLSVVSAQSGSFALDRGSPPVGAPFAHSLLSLLPNLVFRALDEPRLLTALATRMHMQFDATAEAEARLTEMECGPAQRQVAARLCSGETLAQILAEARAPRDVILPLAYVFFESGVLVPA